MADHFEEAKDAILLRTDGNGGPTTRDLLIALQALANDGDDSCDMLRTIIEKNHEETRMLAKRNFELIDKHLKEDVAMSNDEFHAFINGFLKKHEDRDIVVAALHKEVEGIKKNCIEAHAREPRRHNDPPTVDYSTDQDIEDVRRLSKTTKRILLAAAAAGVIFWMDWLSHILIQNY